MAPQTGFDADMKYDPEARRDPLMFASFNEDDPRKLMLCRGGSTTSITSF